ncbi:hypothetical protein GOZ89_12920 [Agrobacterium vitis]|uniref:hypothetical protein n=1 Tax=Agrobacterium vitis TaxID=373 RepID=UPI0012E8D767|nr:hypothetical protein [Agrobacterium vitis]MCF1453193.1 hypothetical protein [Agrobacterium vitis]MCF1467798.1 hypothetical protein [Agrobacterium vitis]MVA80322.1 hypothetical protein [Agrobacterium vitis]
MKRCIRANFYATIVGVISGFLAFNLYLASIAPRGGEGSSPPPPQDLFLVGFNLLPMAVVAYVVSFASLHFSIGVFHLSMSVLFVAFVVGLTALLFVFFEAATFREDLPYLLAMLISGTVLLFSHWGFVAYKGRQGGFNR